ncbi:NfeD family protein [Herbaspirillum lusitanum]|uniref:NfeD family protein n=1 Tax=Herbaspirillum lusitanum TaxID=213312 RepID=UPI0002D7AC78|nr:NfeD family protein [Herbaspirillum lusitanum]
MMDWAIWFVAAGVAIGVELFTGTFYLLMIAIGLGAGGVAALLGGKLEWQLLLAAAIGFAAIGALRRSRFGRRHENDAGRDPNVNLDIGQSVSVDHWNDLDGTHTARIRYRGAEWDVELAAGSPVQAGQFIIREVRGSRLIVSHQASQH